MLLVNTLCLAFYPFFRFLPYFLSFFHHFRLFGFRHCERSEAIQPQQRRIPSGLLCRFAPRNDDRRLSNPFRHCERSEAIQTICIALIAKSPDATVGGSNKFRFMNRQINRKSFSRFPQFCSYTRSCSFLPRSRAADRRRTTTYPPFPCRAPR